jgi:hypothetical protein
MIHAIGWAFQQPIAYSSWKFVLVALADACSDEWESWTCIETIAAKTGLNRKTIIGALDQLEKLKVIEDTGKRVGRTQQVKVYRLKGEESQKRNSSVFGGKESRFWTERVPKTGHVPLPIIRTKDPYPPTPQKELVLKSEGIRAGGTPPTYSAIYEKLKVLYGRPDTVRPSYAEMSCLSEIIRRENAFAELAEILGFHERLPIAERRFFPNSLSRLLQDWQEVLDRARRYEPTHAKETRGSRMVRKILEDEAAGH